MKSVKQKNYIFLRSNKIRLCSYKYQYALLLKIYYDNDYTQTDEKDT